jgi:secondary thiamine-phosphate synthase enzyme
LKSLTEYLTFNTEKEIDFINITSKIESLVVQSQIQEGICLVNAMHITASVFINDEEEGLKQDFKDWLEKFAPRDPSLYRHNLGSEDNGHAHLKRTVMGREVVIAITGQRLDFGPWEQVFYGEFDGKRPKKVLVKMIGD